MTNQNTQISKELDNRKEEIRLLLEDGLSVKEIARNLSLGYASVYNAIKRNDLSSYVSVKNNGKSESSRTYQRNQSRFTEDILREEYELKKLNLYEIAQKYHTSASNVLLYMRKFGIETRTKSEASSVTYERRGESLREKFRQLAYDGVTGIHVKGRKRTETWIEKLFEEYCKRKDIPYEKQYRINLSGHRYDFKVFDNIIVELDGAYWHNTDKQKALDERHDMLAKNQGYDIIRFSDILIKETKGMCFDRVIELV